MITEQNSTDLSTAALKTTPPWIAVAVDRVFGMTLNDWMMLLAIIYTILQIVVLVRNQFIRNRAKANVDE